MSKEGGAGSPEEIAPILRGKISLEAWLTERADNCARIVLVKTGADQRGWLEDEAYFRAAIKAIRDARARALEEQWQPIETAPEQGKMLLWVHPHGEPTIGWHCIAVREDGFFYDDDGENLDEYATPYWAPPPAPPGSLKAQP